MNIKTVSGEDAEVISIEGFISMPLLTKQQACALRDALCKHFGLLEPPAEKRIEERESMNEGLADG